MNVNLKCECGKFQAIIKNPKKSNSNRAVCLCVDCQSFAHYLEKPEKILDSNGGTEIFATYPSQIEFVKGVENLKSMKLSPKGLLRWYVDCCRTPIANTPGVKMPFTAIFHNCIELNAKDKDSVFGKLSLRFFGKYGKKPLPPETYQGAPLSLSLKMFPFLMKGLIFKKHIPHAFFNEDRSPKVEPIILTKIERERLKLKSYDFIA